MASHPKNIYAGNKKLRFYDVYDTWEEALRTGKYYQRLCKCNYFILKTENLWGEKEYALYLNKIYSF